MKRIIIILLAMMAIEANAERTYTFSDSGLSVRNWRGKEVQRVEVNGDTYVVKNRYDLWKEKHPVQEMKEGEGIQTIKALSYVLGGFILFFWWAAKHAKGETGKLYRE